MPPLPHDLYEDPRVLENPIEAGIELADLTEKWLPGLKRRSLHLSMLGLAWTIAMAALATVSGMVLWAIVRASGSYSLSDLAIAMVTPIIIVPCLALGVILLLLAIQESRFLPHLDQSSKAMSALGGRPGKMPERQKGTMGAKPDGKGKGKGDAEAAAAGKGEEKRRQGPALAGILGTSMQVGDLVPMVGRMTIVARAGLAMIIVGLAYFVGTAILLVMLGSFLLLQVILELAMFALFVGPVVLLYKDLTKDQQFYNYYTQRHRAVGEATAIGTPPVPEGPDHLARFDTFVKSMPGVAAMVGAPDGGVRKNVGRKDFRFERLYHGPSPRGPGYDAILVRSVPKIPTRDELDEMLAEAKALSGDEGIDIGRVVALVAADMGDSDIDDDVYEHIIEAGRKARRGECVVQLVMEVEGTYSLVPYVAM